MWPPRFSTATSASQPAGAHVDVSTATLAASDCRCAIVRFAAASSSCGSAATPSSLRNAVQHPLHEEVAADEHVPREPSRGSPNTDVIGTSSLTTGMWQDWQLCFSRKSLCSHS